MKELDDATLVAFVDGELEPTAMREVAALVARDPAAEEKYAGCAPLQPWSAPPSPTRAIRSCRRR